MPQSARLFRFLPAVFFGLTTFLLPSCSRAQDTRTVNEPAIPQTCATLAATQAITNGEPASETSFDTARIQAALSACGSGKAVELTTGGTNNAFLLQPITIPDGVTLLIDAGVTVFASRNPADYQLASSTESCGTVGTLGTGCVPLISFQGGSGGSGLMGYGILNGRGGDKLLVNGTPSTQSWWDLSAAANATPGKLQNNPMMVYATGASNLTLYKITLLNSPLFHVRFTSGSGLTVWGIKIVTPYTARNTDGIDITDNVNNVTIANSYISDGDDMIALSAPSKPAANISLTNDHTYSGRGVSIGSYTAAGVSNVAVTGVNMAGNLSDANAGGLKIKSANDRGGLVSNVTYQNVCVQNERQAVQLNPNFVNVGGTSVPTFQNITYRNVTVQNSGAYPMQLQVQGRDANHLSTVNWDNLNILNGFTNSGQPQYTTITLGPGPVNPTILQQLSGPGISYQGNITNPNEARQNCPASNFPFLAGELFLSSASTTNQQTLSVPNPATFTLNAVVEPVESASVAPASPITFYEGKTAVGTATLSGNGTVASLTLSNVSSGTHTYTAVYPADADYAALTFGPVVVNVNTTATSTTLSSSTGSTTYGNAVTLTATVTAATGTPTGTVTFRNGSTVLGTAALNTSGVATLTTSTLPAGTDTLTAYYGGATNFGTSNSAAAPVTVTVAQASTSTAISATPLNTTYGTTVTITVNVTSSTSGTPSGSVTIMDGATTLGTAILSNGAATFRTKTLPVGSHTLTAVYSGDANFTSSTSPTPAPVQIFTASSSTTLGFSASSAPFGTNIQMIAIINGGTSTATGTVTFKDGGKVLGTVAIDTSAGSATFSTAALTVGTHNIQATYSGDSNYTGSNSSTLPLNITQAATTTVVTASNSSPTFGSSETFTATVSIPSGTTGTPTGTVNFFDGSTVIASNVALGASGTAIYTTTALTGGSHSITAVYSGDSNYNTSTSAALSLTVSPAATSTTLSAPASIVYGGAATLVATISSQVNGTPTGNVSFYDGTTLLGTVALSSGTATLSAANLGGGTHTLSATYAGDPNFATSTSSAQTLTVTKAPVSTYAVAATPNPSTYGNAVTLSVTLTPVAANPTGTVTFFDGSTSLGTSSLASGAASLPISTLNAGTHSISFTYTGDTNYQPITSVPSNRAVSLVVNQAPGTVSLSASPSTSTYSSPVTLTAAVPAAATGTVTFLDGGASLGTAAISNGVASLTTSSLSGGTHSLTAAYGGDANFTTGTSSAVSVTVNPLTTTTTLAAAPTTVAFGSPVTLTANVSPASASGTVTFLDGSVTLGTAALSNGAATLTTSALSGGTHVLTAVYSGDTNDASSTSAGLSVTVNKAATSLTLSAAPNSPTFGSPVTFTATVSPSAANGTVTFTDGSTTLGGAALANGVATFTTSGLSGGSHTIVATYAGTANYAGSTSPALGLDVNVAASTTSLSANPASSVFPGATTLSATISPAVGTGTVAFRDNGVLIGQTTVSSGTASLNVTSLSGGSHSFTATYSGDSNVGGSISPAVAFTVAVGPLGLSVSSSASTATYGQQLTFTATFTPPPGSAPTGSVSFLDGSTTLGTAAVTGNSVKFNYSTLTPGSHSITSSYSGDSNYAPVTSAPVSVAVTQGNATLTLTSTPPEATPGATFTLSATVAPVAAGASTPTGSVTFSDSTGTLATVPLNNGLATLSRSLTALGGHAYTATYSGDADYTTTSATLTVNIKQLATTLAIQAAPNSGSYGSTTFAFTAQLTPQAGGPAPTGSITFTNTSVSPAAVLGTVALSSSNSATLSGITLPGGTDNIVASYSGDATYTASDTSAAPAVISVAPAATTTTLDAGAASVPYGTAITLTATVANTVNAPSQGVVSFFDGSTLLGTADVSSTAGIGRLTLPTTVPVGSHAFHANFAGTNNLAASASGNVGVSVTQLTQTIAFGSVLPSSVVYGVAPFTVPVSASSSLAVNLAISGPATLLGDTLQITGAGTVTLTATQPGNSTYQAASPATFVLTVNKAPLTVTPGNVTIAYGAAIPALSGTITGLVNGDNITAAYSTTATSSSAPGNYPITATLSDPGNRLGNYAVSNPGSTLTISANSQTITFPAPPATVTYGVAPITLAATANSGLAITYTVTGPGSVSGATLRITGAGTVVVTATQPGNSIYAAATPVSQTIVVAKASLSLAAANATRAFGAANPAFTGTLTGVVNGDNLTPTYTTTATPSSAPGTYPITPVLADPDGRLVNYAVTSTNGTLTITSSTPALSISPSSASAGYGSPVTFTASFSANAGGNPTGTVTFKDGSSTLGSAPLNASGVATLTTSNLSVGAHSVGASYSGDTNFAAASTTTPASITVTAGASAVSLSVTPSSAAFGATVTLSATVTGGGSLAPTGTVTFKDGAATLGTGSLNASGAATFSTSTLTGGTHTLTAVYGGDSNYVAATSSAASETISGAASATALTASSAQVSYGASETLTATVTSTVSGTPTGTVTFLDGTATLGTGVLNSTSVATFSTSALAVGTHSITARYGGDANYAASTSAAQSVKVVAATIAPTVSVTPASTTYGGTLSFRVTLTSPSTPQPTGTVALKAGTTTLGTGTLVASTGGSSATIAVNTAAVGLGAGSYNAVAFYAGDANYGASDSSASPAAFSVTAAASATTLSLPVTQVRADTIAASNPLTMSATVSSLAGVPSGTVTFLNGTATLGTAALSPAGVATLSLSSLAPGSYNVTAAFPATGNFSASTSAAQTLSVVAPVSVSLSPGSINVGPGSSGTVTATATPNLGYTGAVTLACSSPVAYVTCTASSPGSITGTTAVTSTVTVSVPATYGSLSQPSLPGSSEGGRIAWAMMLPAGVALLCGRSRRRLGRGLQVLGVLLLLGAAGTAITGCGGGSSSNSPSLPPAGAQTVTVTATANGVSSSSTFTVNVTH